MYKERKKMEVTLQFFANIVANNLRSVRRREKKLLPGQDFEEAMTLALAVVPKYQHFDKGVLKPLVGKILNGRLQETRKGKFDVGPKGTPAKVCLLPVQKKVVPVQEDLFDFHPTPYSRKKG